MPNGMSTKEYNKLTMLAASSGFSCSIHAFHPTLAKISMVVGTTVFKKKYTSITKTAAPHFPFSACLACRLNVDNAIQIPPA